MFNTANAIWNSEFNLFLISINGLMVDGGIPYSAIGVLELSLLLFSLH